MLYFPRNRSITRYFSFTSCRLRAENFAALHLHPQLYQPIVLFCFFADRLLAGASLGVRNVSGRQHSFLSSLSFHQFLYLLLFQTVAGCYFPIGLPLIMTFSYIFNPLLYLCVLSCHTVNLLSQFLFYNRRPFFQLSVARGTVHRPLPPLAYLIYRPFCGPRLPSRQCLRHSAV